MALEPALCSLLLRLLALVRSFDHQGLAAFLHCLVPMTLVAACTRASLRLAPALSTWLWVAPLEKLAHSWVNLRKGAFSSAAICAFSFGSLDF